jgi:predicted Rossmann fold flavoprotein
MTTYDVAVIGGGPAGMMAAGRAAQRGARVILLEKNNVLGKKLLLTGGGRCNLTNATFDRNLFLSKFHGATKFLHSPLAAFGIQDTLDFFAALGVSTKTEDENRVFPKSDKAVSVLEALRQYMVDGGVTVMTDAEVDGFETADSTIRGIWLKDGNIIVAHSYIVTTGGKSHPQTGSTGDGFLWLHELGHTINEPRPSLVPIRIREPWALTLSGLSFVDAKLTVLQNGKKHSDARGKILFTHFGLSGPLVLNMSRTISELMKNKTVTVLVDLLPTIEISTLDLELRTMFDKNKNKSIIHGLEGIVPYSCLVQILALSGIPNEKVIHDITREQRQTIAKTLKGLQMTVSGLLDADKAIVTSGGVSPKEVDFTHMRSRLHPNLYLAGDILDIDRPSGGYSLQLCWTTGFVAGTSASAVALSE